MQREHTRDSFVGIDWRASIWSAGFQSCISEHFWLVNTALGQTKKQKTKEALWIGTYFCFHFIRTQRTPSISQFSTHRFVDCSVEHMYLLFMKTPHLVPFSKEQISPCLASLKWCYTWVRTCACSLQNLTDLYGVSYQNKCVCMGEGVQVFSGWHVGSGP